jgi:hypothetical protein
VKLVIDIGPAMTGDQGWNVCAYIDPSSYPTHAKTGFNSINALSRDKDPTKLLEGVVRQLAEAVVIPEYPQPMSELLRAREREAMRG